MWGGQQGAAASPWRTSTRTEPTGRTGRLLRPPGRWGYLPNQGPHSTDRVPSLSHGDGSQFVAWCQGSGGRRASRGPGSASRRSTGGRLSVMTPAGSSVGKPPAGGRMVLVRPRVRGREKQNPAGVDLPSARGRSFRLIRPGARSFKRRARGRCNVKRCVALTICRHRSADVANARSFLSSSDPPFILQRPPLYPPALETSCV